MSKKKEKNQEEPSGKMKTKEFEKELEKLQVELVKLQRWVVHTGLRMIIVFEGRDAAGKGGTIKRIVELVSPRVFRVVGYLHQQNARNLRCTCSATWRISQREVKSSSATKTSEGKLATECTLTATECLSRCEAMFMGSQL